MPDVPDPERAIRRLTTDHSYVGVQVKLGLISEEEALRSPMRSMLTRSIGKDPIVQVDYSNAVVGRGDLVMQCSDGLYCHVTEKEIVEIATHAPPEEACKQLTELAVKRGTDDNLSVQIVQVDRVEQLSYYRGAPVYQEAPDTTMSHEVQIGDVLDNRFRIIDVVARSGMASIYKAVDLQTGKTVALKVPSMQFESDPGFFTRFQREEEIGRLLDHPFILHVVPVAEKSRPYMAMEFLEGQTLRQLMRSVERLPAADALQIASRLCDALDHMHKKNVIHRDLKPENVMLCNDGTLRIMDFGIAKAAGMRRLTFTGFSPVMGTPDYIGAGAGQGQARRRAHRPLQPRRHAVRDGDGGRAVRGGEPLRHHELAPDRRPAGAAQGQCGHPAEGGGDHPARDGAQPRRALPVGGGDEGGAGRPGKGGIDRPVRPADSRRRWRGRTGRRCGWW